MGGAQKSGTSTLDAWLRLHPGIRMSEVKETHFFDDESRDWENPDYRDLEELLPEGTGFLRGESTPISFYWGPSIERLARYRPELRFVILLRNPVTRAHSHWHMEISRSTETLSFSDAIRKGRRRMEMADARHQPHRIYSYVERGFYAHQLEFLLGHFPREQIHFETFETFFPDPLAGLQRIATFLGLQAPFGPVANLHLNAAHDAAYAADLSEYDHRHLVELYREDVEKLELLLGRGLPEWTDFERRAAGMVGQDSGRQGTVRTRSSHFERDLPTRRGE